MLNNNACDWSERLRVIVPHVRDWIEEPSQLKYIKQPLRLDLIKSFKTKKFKCWLLRQKNWPTSPA